MPPKKPPSRHERFRSGATTDEDIQHLAEKLDQMFPPDWLALMKEYGIDPHMLIRFSLLGNTCKTRRAELGWDQKQAAARVGIPVYRVKAIESSLNREMSRKETRLYARILGIEPWFLSWLDANRATFDSLDEAPEQKTSWAARIRRMEL